MRALTSMVALAAAGIVVVTGVSARADTVNLGATILPGAEVFLAKGLVPTAPYKGKVLVKLENNTVPTEVKIGTCKGRYIGAVTIVANDHAPYVAADPDTAPACIRFKVKNLGTTPATIAGAGYF
ncbi:hypothetical protein OHA77_08780 [Streptosporangium sp. NBC_01639]|uniref:hypothetical protein n=1 Tax=unclassified Streptosporangium TaxID=2632669 RepID=UPI002DDB8510|nr:hypothetical protein [Streptosporangium sp. NBC_01756]WSC84757.1 hypothetical protein OIE48_30905 [Streptosporangium sp. NBC_01756]WTD56609.1 hypothetical protein OHA77_08780 [Streptosporangium sp. NBC_01639]